MIRTGRANSWSFGGRARERCRGEAHAPGRRDVARSLVGPLALLLLAVSALAGCSGTIVPPGHRGLYFDPRHGGLNHEILPPGFYRTSGASHVEDFDVTYSTKRETLSVLTSEALPVEIRVAVIYRPIIAELWMLDSEIGPAYYDEVIGPELRSATRIAFEHRSCVDLVKVDERLEAELEASVRQRTRGKHIEIASIVFESVRMPPELAAALKDRLVAQEHALGKKADLEQETTRAKVEAERAWEKEKTELEHDAERQRLKRQAAE
jgi:regulator of protease activity HflC (stomatin/prohibitin superfamily)